MANDLTQAKRLIRECLETQNPTLDIGNCGITDLDELPELFECVHLETLIVSNKWWDPIMNVEMESQNSGLPNKLHTIPGIIGFLKNLKHFTVGGWWEKDKDWNIERWNISDISWLSNLMNLQTLNLSYTQISDTNGLEKLSNLLSLNLSSNQISVINGLDNLCNLQCLDLSSNQINIIKGLGNLSTLQSLKLNSNQISVINGLENLCNLQYLDLSSNQINIIKGLDNLSTLQSLNLNSNNISVINGLEKLNNLQSLDLSFNKISVIRGLKNLCNLQSLFLVCNQISVIRGLEMLNNLQILDLRSNQINVIRGLEMLNNLQTLVLSSNQIYVISGLESLTNLQALYLDSNQIRVISGLEMLNNLQTLGLRSNQISVISGLENLNNLQVLYLGSNQISVISGLEKLSNLQSLDLSSNKISVISGLENPNNLQNLYLNSNLVSDISGLNGFLNLRLAIIDSNKISTIPLAICESALNISVVKNSHNIGEITLSNNPITEPPLEIVKQGRQAMLDWYAAKRQRLKEIKIILIGDPKAGKTSLLRRLKDDTFNAEEVQTDGINIEDIRFGECDSFKKQTSLHPLTGHFWDFGGQEIMNATHQFFLTNRSVYLLVLDARNDKEIAGQIRQWIKRIKANGGNSPIIVVANKIDINAGFGFSNEYDLQQEFSQIKGFIKLSCSSGDNLRQLKDKLSEDIPQAEMFSTSIDERWIPIKEELQKKTKKYDFLDEDAFVKICQQYKLTKSHEQESAIEFFHDLGLVLHFKELQLAEYYVLDPYWITYGVYQILTSAFAAKCHGEVAMQKLGFIVNEEEDKISVYRSSRFRKITYTTFQLRFLVEILHQFKLCYCMPNYEHFIIPDLLDTTEPITVTEPIRNDKNRIHIIYEYDYLPRSIIPNIIVEANRIITEKWRTGCVFVVDSCKALISSYQNQLLVTVTGEYKKKREVMAVMRNLIDGINRTLSNKPGILVPLYDTDNKLYADYETLLVMEKDKEKKYKLYTPKKQEWEISRLLDGIPGEDEVQSAQLKKLMLEIKDDVNCVKSNILFVGEQLQKTLDNHFDYLLKLPSIDNIRDELLPAVAVLQTEQYTEIANDIVTFTISQLSTFEGRLSKQLVDIHADLKKTTDTQMKLKLSIPILKQLGVDFNTEFNLTSWAKKMHNKYKLEIFKLLMITNKIPL